MLQQHNYQQLQHNYQQLQHNYQQLQRLWHHWQEQSSDRYQQYNPPLQQPLHSTHDTPPMLATHSLVEYRLAVSKGQGSFGLRIGHTPGRPTTVLGFSIVAADEGGDAAGRGPVERLGVVHIGDMLAGINGMCVNTDRIVCAGGAVVTWP